MSVLLFLYGSLVVGNQSPSDQILKAFWEGRSDVRSANRVQDAYHVSPERFGLLVEGVTRRMIAPDMDYRPGVSVTQRALSIKQAVQDLVSSEQPSANALLKERLVVQGVYDWTRTHLTYNMWLSNLTNDREVRKHYWKAEELFTFKHPTAVCAGFEDVMAKMAIAAGINAIPVDGVLRKRFDSTFLPADPRKIVHGWVLIRQSDGYVFPCDPTQGRVGLDQARNLQGKILVGLADPIFPLDWALYFAYYFPTQTIGKEIPPEFRLLRFSYDEWRSIDASPLRRTHGNLVGSPWSGSATIQGQPTEHLPG